jgi:fermentation-respiration switch protein FrsA (DUF1100 family)
MIEAQFAYLASLPGADTAALAKQRLVLEAPMARVRALTPADASNTTPIAGAPASYWLDLAHYDVVAATKALALPILVLQGGRDYQVTPDDVKAWERAVGPRPNLRVRWYPSLNHLFIAGEGVPSPAEYAKPGTVDAGVVDDLAGWVNGLGPRS